MNKQNPSVIPDEKKIEELLGKIQPVPGEEFHQKMKQAPWVGKQSRPSSIPLRMRLAIAMMVVIILATLAATPQGRAWAQDAFQFFKQVNVTSIPLSDKEVEQQYSTSEEIYDLPLIPVIIPAPPSEMLALPGCETAEKAQSYSCQIAYVESQLGFDLMELPERPQDLEFDSVDFNINTQASTIGYGQFGMSLRITQKLGKAPNQYGPWDWVPEGKVEKIKVANFDGEYVSGSFIYSSNGTEMIWSDQADKQRLAWSDGTFWYLIESYMYQGMADYFNREQLIQLAGSLVKTPQIQEEQLDPEALSSVVYSISGAEKISGLDLKAPTILPMEIDFSFARYTSFDRQVQLEYGVNSELVIREWVGKPIAFNDVSANSNLDYEVVMVNGEKAYYGSSVGTADGHLLLWWHRDGLNYQMSFYEYFGARMDKEKMIVIAESMQDINDFRIRGKKSYSQIILYEQALGIDARKFPETPAGWTFYGFHSASYAQCIGLVYTSTTGQSQLYINQCKTDKLQEILDFPRRYTDRVRVRDTKGLYVTGEYVTAQDGTQVWDPAFPRKVLTWQEDGLWMQISVLGDAALVTDKDDLISYAESLQ
jgi:hypothetical protein